jgi:hypothetical protein
MGRLLVTVSLIVTVVSCGGDGKAPSVITGAVVAVDSHSLTEVESFVVRSEGERYTILIDERTDLDFPPAHLNEHRISGEPVRVEVDARDGELVATSIADG